MLQQHPMHGPLFDEERLTAEAMNMSLSGNKVHITRWQTEDNIGWKRHCKFISYAGSAVLVRMTVTIRWVSLI